MKCRSNILSKGCFSNHMKKIFASLLCQWWDMIWFSDVERRERIFNSNRGRFKWTSATFRSYLGSLSSSISFFLLSFVRVVGWFFFQTSKLCSSCKGHTPSNYLCMNNNGGFIQNSSCVFNSFMNLFHVFCIFVSRKWIWKD